MYANIRVPPSPLGIFLAHPHTHYRFFKISSLGKNSEYDQEIPQPQTADKPVALVCGIVRKSHTTITRHQEDTTHR